MRFLLSVIMQVILVAVSFSQVTVQNLRCEYLKDPLGVSTVQPRLSWELSSPRLNVRQTGYRILVADDSSLLNKNVGNIWDSRRIRSNTSFQIPYGGKKLNAGKKYYWKVMVWDEKAAPSVYSHTSFWQMGLLTKNDWSAAQWIAYDVLPDTAVILPFRHGGGEKAWGTRRNVLPLFRRSFTIDKEIKTATVFISGLGHFEMRINGAKTGDHFLDPGWTQYAKHAQYVTFDIREQLQRGVNVIGVMLGNGFYYIPGERYRKLTGAYGYPKMIAKLHMEFTDGSVRTLVSDESWKTTASPVYFSSIFGGEDYDAGREQAGWDKTGFNDTSWNAAITTQGPAGLDAQMAPPVKVMQEFHPVSKKQLASNRWVYDLGQNFSGIPAVAVSGNKGDTVRLYPAELINADGTANQNATGNPHYYTYVLKGRETEIWQPRFSYYGFRYIQVETSSGSGPGGRLPAVNEIKGLHIRSSADEIGSFKTSSELFNRTFELIRWGIRSNTVSVFTDCPHREKLGWMEQNHLMGNSVQYSYDVAALFTKAVRDMIHAQTEEGLIPDIAPEYVHFDGGFRDSPEWGSAGIILPWYMYQWYGDTAILREAYPMMKRYITYLKGKSKEHILDFGLGDWFDLGPEQPGVSQLTPVAYTATATYYYDLSIISQIAALLKDAKESVYYQELAGEVKKAFNQKYFNRDTRQYATGSQAANAMALYMDLVEKPEDRKAVLENLVQDIKRRNSALTGGDVGYRYILRALEDGGRSDVIYDMNSRTDVPGYGYQLAKGATALTESWAALPTVSNNHFMLGHLMEWMYSGLCGIKQAKGSLGYRQIEIRPQPVGDIRFAAAGYRAVSGPVKTSWKKEGASLVVEVEIPANTAATVYFPPGYDKTEQKIGSGKYRFQVKMK